MYKWSIFGAFGGMIILILFGAFSHQIERHYGNQRSFYDESHTGDIIVNRDKGEVRLLKKTWKRIYASMPEGDIDLLQWQHDRMEVYRLVDGVPPVSSLSVEAIDELLVTNKIKLIIQSR